MYKIVVLASVLLLIPPVKSEDSTAINFQTLAFDKDVNNGNDQALVQQIRHQLANESDLSANAKNVKIIIVKKEITLKGAVDTENERNKIKAVISRLSKSHVIRDQMEVATTRE